MKQHTSLYYLSGSKATFFFTGDDLVPLPHGNSEFFKVRRTRGFTIFQIRINHL